MVRAKHYLVEVVPYIRENLRSVSDNVQRFLHRAGVLARTRRAEFLFVVVIPFAGVLQPAAAEMILIIAAAHSV